MTSSELIERVVYSFIVGALSVSAITITADRFGSKLAGALGGFPATVAASFYFMAAASEIRRAVEATAIIPISMAIFGIFLVVYISLVNRGIFEALIVSFVVWTTLSAVPLAAGVPEYAWGIVFFALALGSCWYIVEYALSIPAVTGQRIRLRPAQTMFRMCAGGTVVALSVVVGAVVGPLLGGMAAAFPAVTTATLVVTYQSGGAALSQAVAKALMLSGMINVTVFSVAIRYLYPLFGIVWGTVVGACVGIAVSVSSYLFLRYASR